MKKVIYCKCGHDKGNHSPKFDSVKRCYGDRGRCICRDGFRPQTFSHDAKLVASLCIESEGRYARRGRELGALVEEKNAAYGDAGMVVAGCMKLLYPNGISFDQITDALYTVRVMDKLCRIANRKNAFGENPWSDVGGYGILCSVNEERVAERRTDEDS